MLHDSSGLGAIIGAGVGVHTRRLKFAHWWCRCRSKPANSWPEGAPERIGGRVPLSGSNFEDIFSLCYSISYAVVARVDTSQKIAEDMAFGESRVPCFER